MDTVHIPEMDTHSLEVYPEKMVYEEEDVLHFCVKSMAAHQKVEISRITGPHQYTIEYTSILGKFPTPTLNDPAVNGCGWKPNLSLTPREWSPAQGYYRFKITGDIQESISSFLVSKRSQARIAVFSPVSTWTAYNPYGGKSLYKNFVDNQTVHKVSTLRPNTAVQYKEELSIHDINIEAQIYNWFAQHYTADLYADYHLEKGKSYFEQYQILVISYHMEYVSAAMLHTLEQLEKAGKSIIFLGANQCYWKIQWHKMFTELECHKDYAPFKSPYAPGGMWRHNQHHEALIQGVAFNDKGMSTYAPYVVTNPHHWVYQGLELKSGDLFGERGMNALPICGDETDKMHPLTPRGFQQIAKGLNPENSGELLIWPDPKVQWNSKGGGDFVVLTKETHGILSTGSIQSGSGLGTDPVFTRIIKNFTDRYLH